MVRKIRTALCGSVAGRRLAVLGLAFKANTDDMRKCPLPDAHRELLAERADVHAFDPAAAGQAAELLPDLVLAASIEEALVDADAAIVLTERSAFRSIPWQALRSTM